MLLERTDYKTWLKTLARLAIYERGVTSGRTDLLIIAFHISSKCPLHSRK